jgi:hypothetical protein
MATAGFTPFFLSLSLIVPQGGAVGSFHIRVTPSFPTIKIVVKNKRIVSSLIVLIINLYFVPQEWYLK